MVPQHQGNWLTVQRACIGVNRGGCGVRSDKVLKIIRHRDWLATVITACFPALSALLSPSSRLRGAPNSSPSDSIPEALVVDLTQYLPILIFLVIAIGLSTAFVFLPMGVARLTGTHNPNAEKLSEYECGFPAFEDPRSQFDVRFYLIAILFIVFDLEAAFLFPWAVSLDLTGWPGWITMMVFLFELAVGLAYAWKKGALEWE
jgi:NADH-quinone oxidoreductase subunit A